MTPGIATMTREGVDMNGIIEIDRTEINRGGNKLLLNQPQRFTFTGGARATGNELRVCAHNAADVAFAVVMIDDGPHLHLQVDTSHGGDDRTAVSVVASIEDMAELHACLGAMIQLARFEKSGSGG